MVNVISGLLHGVVFETPVKSFTGKYLYSDYAGFGFGLADGHRDDGFMYGYSTPRFVNGEDDDAPVWKYFNKLIEDGRDPDEVSCEKNTSLNSLASIPIIGIAGGIARVALGVIHTVGHLFLALCTLKKGHLFHAAKGGCEIIRGVIESIPIVGRVFSWTYGMDYSRWPEPIYGRGIRNWWIIKIYNPRDPDGLDRWMNNWRGFPERFYARA